MMRTSFGYDRHVPSWFNELEQGIILIQGGYITHVNTAAGTMLDVDPNRVAGLSIIAVVRDHRLEQAYLENSTVVLNTRGRILQASGIRGGLYLQDITALKTLEANTRELLAVLSHELRTPVTTIQSTLEALHYNLPQPQQARFLLRAQQETERLKRLLEDLTIDVKPPQARSVHIGDIVKRAISVLQPVLTEHDITLVQKLELLTIWVDPDKFLQVLINLLENAALHGPNHATVTLCAHTNYDVASLHFLDIGTHQFPTSSPPHPNQDDAMAYVYVQDTGTPLPHDSIKALFEPHAQGKQSNKGTGLGLYIVKSIAARAGGMAWGKPLDGGNEFGIALPLSKY